MKHQVITLKSDLIPVLYDGEYSAESEFNIQIATLLDQGYFLLGNIRSIPLDIGDGNPYVIHYVTLGEK